LRAASDLVAKACDAIMSDVVDEFFAVPATWDELADSLGVTTIEKSDEFEDTTPWLKELFRLTCAAPDLTEREKRIYAAGYKKVLRTSSADEEDDLAQAYTMFTDGGADWFNPRRLLEKDWADLLKVDHTVKLDIRTDNNNVYIRFRQGPAKAPTAINQQIVDPTHWEKRL
jgi:hypothetical protein